MVISGRLSPFFVRRVMIKDESHVAKRVMNLNVHRRRGEKINGKKVEFC